MAVVLLMVPVTMLPTAKAEVQKAAGKSNGRFEAYSCDVSKAQPIIDTIKKVQTDLGKVDILVNNAGQSKTGQFDTLRDADWQGDLDLKVFGAIRWSRLVWPQMKERRWGRIINVLSIQAKSQGGGSAPTSASGAGRSTPCWRSARPPSSRSGARTWTACSTSRPPPRRHGRSCRSCDVVRSRGEASLTMSEWRNARWSDERSLNHGPGSPRSGPARAELSGSNRRPGQQEGTPDAARPYHPRRGDRRPGALRRGDHGLAQQSAEVARGHSLKARNSGSVWRCYQITQCFGFRSGPGHQTRGTQNGFEGKFPGDVARKTDGLTGISQPGREFKDVSGTAATQAGHSVDMALLEFHDLTQGAEDRVRDFAVRGVKRAKRVPRRDAGSDLSRSVRHRPRCCPHPPGVAPSLAGGGSGRRRSPRPGYSRLLGIA